MNKRVSRLVGSKLMSDIIRLCCVTVSYVVVRLFFVARRHLLKRVII